MRFYQKPYLFFVLMTLSSCAQANFPYEEATITSIQDAIVQKKNNCRQVTQLYLDRIKSSNFAMHNAKAPLNAFVSINPNVFQQAQDLDEFYEKNKKLKGTLHCIPIVIKDNIDSYDSPSSSGTFALLGSQPIKDAFIVKKLREAGAVIIGKTSMDEMASGFWGISSRSGRTGNAYNTLRNAGGSSGGSAVAVSANFAVIGLGTDNSGSVRVPAAYNGLYALRPSTGLISQSGLFPRGNMDGVVGPMARTVEDLAIVLDVIAQRDPQDQKTHITHREKTYLPKKDVNVLKGITIGILTKVNGIDQFREAEPSVMEVYQNAIINFEKLGAKIINNIELSTYNMDRQYNRAGEREEIDTYLKNFPSTRKNYQDLCQSGRIVFEGGIQGCLKDITTIPPLRGPEFQRVLEIFKENKNKVQELMESQHLDLLMTPIDAKGVPALGFDNGDTLNGVVASNAGLPALTIIAGIDAASQMPVGLELIGKQYDEKRLIQIANIYEKQQPRPVPVIASDNQGQQLTIEKINNVITVLGKNAFEQYLKKGNKQALTADRFAQIVKTVLEKQTD